MKHQIIGLIDIVDEKQKQSDLNDQTSDGRDPVSKVGDAGESSGQTNFASSGGAKADNSDLVVDTVVDKSQWAARVTLYIVSSI